MRIQFVGQAPSRETDGKPPFTGKCGRFLAELLGTTQEQMLLDHKFINVLDSWPGKGIGGDKFPMPAAKISARKKLMGLKGKLCILLGNNVARAFDCKQFQYFSWYEIRNPENFSEVIVPWMTIIPHPSGLVRHWNNPDNRLLAAKFLQGIAAK